MKISEKHLHSVIPKPHDSDEDDPKVELNEDDEVVNLEAVTERLATDLKLTVLKDTIEGEDDGTKQQQQQQREQQFYSSKVMKTCETPFCGFCGNGKRKMPFSLPSGK